ncbi:hypothetical protein AB1Y20_003993 [Prymnesium parvum]|uniref:Uncharacterized protein n=1 Tax=Prymnesium parvum TaxID=97485 RepID=A0AB34J5D6_PRYPA
MAMESSVSSLSARTPVMSRALLTPRERSSHLAAGSPDRSVNEARLTTSHHFAGGSFELAAAAESPAKPTPGRVTRYLDVTSHMAGASLVVTADPTSNLRTKAVSGCGASLARIHGIGRRESTALPKQLAKGSESAHAASSFSGGSMCLTPQAGGSSCRDTGGLRLSPKAWQDGRGVHSSHFEGASMCVSPQGKTAAPLDDVQREVVQWREVAKTSAEMKTAGRMTRF